MERYCEQVARSERFHILLRFGDEKKRELAGRVQSAAKLALQKFREHVDPSIKVIENKAKFTRPFVADGQDVFDDEQLIREWDFASSSLFSSVFPDTDSIKTAYSHWKSLERNPRYRNLAREASLCLSRSASNATVERQFSLIKQNISYRPTVVYLHHTPHSE